MSVFDNTVGKGNFEGEVIGVRSADHEDGWLHGKEDQAVMVTFRFAFQGPTQIRETVRTIELPLPDDEPIPSLGERYRLTKVNNPNT